MVSILDEKSEKPSYYAIIPAIVRYDQTLTPLAKLLYGEITSLSNKNGFCWASNSYFAALYGVSETWVSLTIKKLEDLDYIFTEVDNQMGNIRMIYINKKNSSKKKDYKPYQTISNPSLTTVNTSLSTVKDPSLSTVKDLYNNTSINNKERKRIKKEKNTLLEVLDKCTPREHCGHCSHCSLVACSPLDLWTIAQQMDIWIEDVKEKHKAILQLIETGEFQLKYKKDKTVYYTLQNWLRMDLTRGYIQKMNEMQRLALPLEHPKHKAELQRAYELARKMGKL